MNMQVPSMEPGASSLPAELRIPRGDNETVHGRSRLAWGQRHNQRPRRQLGFLPDVGLPRGWGAGAGQSLHGIGQTMYDATNDEYYEVADYGGQPYEVVRDFGPTMIDTNPQSVNYGQLISQSTGALANIIALTQGGSVSAGPRGTVIQGSTPGAVTQATAGGGALNVGAGGIQAAFGNNGMWIMAALGVGLLFMMNQRGR